MTGKLKDHIAEPVSLEAGAIHNDDWIILYVNRATIRRTGGLSWFKLNDQTVSCGPYQQ